MTPFTSEELAFLRRHNFTEGDVHDGRRQGKRLREYYAREAGKVLILTSVRCRAMGHRIRTRAGHCAQCNPASIAFTARENSPGNVYIAGSLSGRLIKIGTTGDIAQRMRQLRAQQYGGFGDWSVLISIRVNDAGQVERGVSSQIRGKRVFNGYIKDGREQVAIELIQCSFSAAFKALSNAVGGIPRSQYWLDQNCEYEFD
jgi:hypothetical protein